MQYMRMHLSNLMWRPSWASISKNLMPVEAGVSPILEEKALPLLLELAIPLKGPLLLCTLQLLGKSGT